MATHHRTVICDNCNRKETAPAFVIDHAKLFQKEGWLTISSVSPNGTIEYADLCQSCARQFNFPLYTPIPTKDWREYNKSN